MGSYSYLTIGGYPIFENKNSHFTDVVDNIFQLSDFVIEKRPFLTRNILHWGDAYKGKKGNFTFKGFKQTAKICRERLEIYGFTVEKAKKDFKAAIKIAKEASFYSFPIEKVSFEEYMNEMKSIILNKERNYDQLFTNLKESLITGELSIVGQSTAGSLYCILSTLPDDTIVEYDLTDVIRGGWVKAKEVKQINIEKIIVLTEGKTDVEFLSASLDKLYPHLSYYYHFINFDEYKVESNASALVKLTTSLAASNIKHPIIVLFDNDTTGIMEMKKLSLIKLPNNFKVLKYPDIRLAKKYPTIGPTGSKKMNINGSACGIEVYFGQDVLAKDNFLIPVQWKGFNEKENKYQGEISEKSLVQNRFREKLKSNENVDFSDIDLILKQIFRAFQ